jgi:hypothetical protein
MEIARKQGGMREIEGKREKKGYDINVPENKCIKPDS